MISKTINALVQAIVTEFAKYGIRMDAMYHPDLEAVTQYTKSLNLRSMFKEQQIDLLTPEQVDNLKKKSYVLMLYNYSPFRRSETPRMRNLNMQLVFDPNTPESLDEFGKLRQVANDDMNLFFRMVRDANALPAWTPSVDGANNVDPSSYPADRAGVTYVVKDLDVEPANTPLGNISNWDKVVFDSNGVLSEVIDSSEPPPPLPGQCRDMVMGQIQLDFKILTSDTDLINDMQFLHVAKLQRNKPLTVELDFGQSVGVHEFEYNTEFGEIEDVGHVDYASYGNLQHLTFTAAVDGPFFSFYSQDEHYIERVDVQLHFTGSDITIPGEVVFPDGI